MLPVGPSLQLTADSPAERPAFRLSAAALRPVPRPPLRRQYRQLAPVGARGARTVAGAGRVGCPSAVSTP